MSGKDRRFEVQSDDVPVCETGRQGMVPCTFGRVSCVAQSWRVPLVFGRERQFCAELARKPVRNVC